MNNQIAIGSVLEVLQHGGNVSKFVVDGYNEDDYMMMTNLTNRQQFMTIHPEHAKRIATNGTDSGIKMIDSRSLNDITVKATNLIVTKKVVEVKPVVVIAKTEGENKRTRALRIIAANPTATRKELITMFISQLDMTPAGASTYASSLK
jgi:hypothetical protein